MKEVVARENRRDERWRTNLQLISLSLSESLSLPFLGALIQMYVILSRKNREFLQNDEIARQRDRKFLSNLILRLERSIRFLKFKHHKTISLINFPETKKGRKGEKEKLTAVNQS